MKKRNKPKLQPLELNESECLRLSLFVTCNRDWVARHSVPLESVLRQSLRSSWIELVRFQKVETHKVYELSVRLGRSSPATKTGIEWVVRQAFAAAGRSVKPKFAHAVLRADRATVTVFVDSWLDERNRIRKPRIKLFLIGRR